MYGLNIMFQISNNTFSIIGILMEYLNVQSIIINSCYTKALTVIKSLNCRARQLLYRKFINIVLAFTRK